MDIVYASLHRKDAAGQTPQEEREEVLAVLWAHAGPADAVQHITVRCEPERVDLLLYLWTRPTPGSTACAPAAADLPAPPSSETGPEDPLAVALDLITRSHQASPALSRRYLPPVLPAAR